VVGVKSRIVAVTMVSGLKWMNSPFGKQHSENSQIL